jgi:AraC-like DNA-binding protein
LLSIEVDWSRRRQDRRLMIASDGRTFTDVEDFVGAVQDAGIMLVVTGPGVFWARLTQLTLPHVRLLVVSESLSRAAYFALSPERVCFGFPLHVNSSSVWKGVRLQRGDFVFHSRGEHFHQRTNGPAEWGLLSVDSERLAATGLTLTGVKLVAPPSGRIMRPARRDIARLLRLHAAAVRFVDKHPKLLLDPEVIRGMQHDLLEGLVGCLTSEFESHSDGRKDHQHIMDRVEQVLAASSDLVMTVPQLCASIGVSERTLQSCCIEFLGIGPGRYLRLRRQRLARLALRAGRSTSGSVAEVARG